MESLMNIHPIGIFCAGMVFLILCLIVPKFICRKLKDRKEWVNQLDRAIAQSKVNLEYSKEDGKDIKVLRDRIVVLEELSREADESIPEDYRKALENHVEALNCQIAFNEVVIESCDQEINNISRQITLLKETIKLKKENNKIAQERIDIATNQLSKED